ncbi:MAG: isoprenyl transferase [Myxococcota bacterium]|nr:isoprenyl transferase [Myxococcota bacterium]
MPSSEISPDRMPRHVAIIMDGNGRWAEARGLQRNRGHLAGVESVKQIVRSVRELGMEYLTLYAFSSENWNRPDAEVSELMRLLEIYLDENIAEAQERGVRLRVMGHMDRLPQSTRAAVDRAVEATLENPNGDLIFALSYGGRGEIVDAVRDIIREVEAGRLDPEMLDEKTFAAHLYLPDVPDPDLLIRTGDECRVSNFLLWQIAYAEIHTTSVMWPDFRREHLEAAICDYQARERRFGMTSAQVEKGDETDDGGRAEPQ